MEPMITDGSVYTQAFEGLVSIVRQLLPWNWRRTPASKPRTLSALERAHGSLRPTRFAPTPVRRAGIGTRSQPHA